MMLIESYEESMISHLLSEMNDEELFNDSIHLFDIDTILILADGFEERSLGLLKKIYESKLKFRTVILGHYIESNYLPDSIFEMYNFYIKEICIGEILRVENNNDGNWIQDFQSILKSKKVLFDISAISNRSLFRILDLLISYNCKILVGYTEAETYFPTLQQWDEIYKELKDGLTIPEVVNEKKWLYGSDHTLELIKDHEGYDSASDERALIAFLHYKSSRLSSILNEIDYSMYVFIAGIPRMNENYWRLMALKEINQSLIKDRLVIDMDTFHWKKQLLSMKKILFVDQFLLEKYNLHFAILGSKMQILSSWILSRCIKSITFLTSKPLKYYPEAFSQGIGETWVIEIPERIKKI